MRRSGNHNGNKSESKSKATGSNLNTNDMNNMNMVLELENTDSGSSSSSSEDMAKSCLSSEYSQGESSPENGASTSMVLVGCPRCLMYVMVAAENEPRCPQCKSSVLLDLEDTNQEKKKMKKKSMN